MDLYTFINKLKTQAETIEFTDTMAVIEQLYDFKETAFTNGDLHNQAGENSGSCKLFAFAHLQGFDQQQTLNCFGTYYRNEVLNEPEGDNHQNIRNFMRTGWDGITFEGQALRLKT